jgi:hypothetical protein
MTPTVTGPDLRALPRFTFAGRGCRDPRREARRLPQSLRLQPPCPPTTTPSPVATVVSGAGGASAGRSSTTGSTGPNDDRPPPAGLRYGPGPWQPSKRVTAMSLWWSSGAVTPS